MVNISGSRAAVRLADPAVAGLAVQASPHATLGSGESTVTGFVARLGGMSLLDLVQFESLRGGQRILRVSSRGHAGYLYFRGGALVHAATAVSTGSAALREMLAWRSGSVESGMGDWPARESIEGPWQRVLLDAMEAELGDDVGAVSGNALRDSLMRLRESVQSARAASSAASEINKTAATVVLGPGGHLIQGAGVHGLPEAAAYAAHMAELIGGFLGFDRFCALEVNYGGEQLLVGRGKSGNLVARREKNPADLQDLRREVAAETDTEETAP